MKKLSWALIRLSDGVRSEIMCDGHACRSKRAHATRACRASVALRHSFGATGNLSHQDAIALKLSQVEKISLTTR